MSKQVIKDWSVSELIGDLGMFLEKRMENDGDGNPIYVGYNRTQNAATTDLSWYIVKLTYSTGFVTRYQLPDDGPQFKYAWDDRATYFS